MLGAMLSTWYSLKLFRPCPQGTYSPVYKQENRKLLQYNKCILVLDSRVWEHMREASILL